MSDDAESATASDSRCSETITLPENWARLPLDCTLPAGHDGPHHDSATNARWVP